jgi:hypothetical protein
MKTLILTYLDENKKTIGSHHITPHAQGAEYDSKKRFDGNWHHLAQSIACGRSYTYKIVEA